MFQVNVLVRASQYSHQKTGLIQSYVMCTALFKCTRYTYFSSIGFKVVCKLVILPLFSECRSVLW